MLETVTWRVEVLHPPDLHAPCARCNEVSRFACAERFRTNAQQGRLDVWLLYRCRSCGATAKQRVLRRKPARELSAEELAGYERDERAAVWRAAFAAGVREPLPYTVARPPLPEAGTLCIEIAQPWPSGVRWDRLLAGELRWSRAAITRGWTARRIRSSQSHLRKLVRNDDTLIIDDVADLLLAR